LYENWFEKINQNILIENMFGKIDVFMNEIGIKNIEPIENESLQGLTDFIMNESLKIESFHENERVK
jgi:hypothetical protein